MGLIASSPDLTKGPQELRKRKNGFCLVVYLEIFFYSVPEFKQILVNEFHSTFFFFMGEGKYFCPGPNLALSGLDYAVKYWHSC